MGNSLFLPASGACLWSEFSTINRACSQPADNKRKILAHNYLCAAQTALMTLGVNPGVSVKNRPEKPFKAVFSPLFGSDVIDNQRVKEISANLLPRPSTFNLNPVSNLQAILPATGTVFG
jgi:hypothetical protein